MAKHLARDAPLYKPPRRPAPSLCSYRAHATRAPSFDMLVKNIELMRRVCHDYLGPGVEISYRLVPKDRPLIFARVTMEDDLAHVLKFDVKRQRITRKIDKRTRVPLTMNDLTVPFRRALTQR